MTTLLRFDPFRELTSLRSDLGGLFDGPARDGASAWTPALDVIDREAELAISVDLPGLRPEDVEIEADVAGGVLTISGERRFEGEAEPGRHHRVERSYGRFTRRLTLPKGAKADAITASFDDGVLSVRVPKADVVKPRRIPVSQAAAA